MGLRNLLRDRQILALDLLAGVKITISGISDPAWIERSLNCAFSCVNDGPHRQVVPNRSNRAIDVATASDNEHFGALSPRLIKSSSTPRLAFPTNPRREHATELEKASDPA
jgi:hypothetical protein